MKWFLFCCKPQSEEGDYQLFNREIELEERPQLRELQGVLEEIKVRVNVNYTTLFHYMECIERTADSGCDYFGGLLVKCQDLLGAMNSKKQPYQDAQSLIAKIQSTYQKLNRYNLSCQDKKAKDVVDKLKEQVNRLCNYLPSPQEGIRVRP